MDRSYGSYGMWGGLWSTGTVMYAYTGRHILVSSFILHFQQIFIRRKFEGKYMQQVYISDFSLTMPQF